MIRKSRYVDVLARVVPVVAPIHHAEKQKGRNPGVDAFDPVLASEFIEQTDNQIDVLPFSRVDLPEQLSGYRVRFVGQHFHLAHVVNEVIEVILYEQFQTPDGIIDPGKQSTAIIDHGAEAIVLYEKEQLFLAFEIIV